MLAFANPTHRNQTLFVIPDEEGRTGLFQVVTDGAEPSPIAWKSYADAAAAAAVEGIRLDFAHGSETVSTVVSDDDEYEEVVGVRL